MTRASFCSTLFLLALWAFFVSFAPSTLYWRDTGEFLLGAYFLDVAHPAGFPTYSLFANLLTLVPLGPIAWRVHLFSSLCALGVLGFSVWIFYRLLTSVFLKTPQESLPYLFLPALFLLGSESFFHQALFAEVYQLNTLFLLAGYALFVEYSLSHDKRLLLFGAFVGGLACGNHVSVVFFLSFGLVVLLISERKLFRLLPALVGSILIGLAVYAYIPIRAKSVPPLNTGDASTLERAASLMTDERDRVLRPHVITEIAGIDSGSWKTFLKASLGDIKRLDRELGVGVTLLGGLGLLVFLFRAPLLGVLLVGLGVTNWLFFKGWQPDPWQPLLFSLSLGAAFAIFVVLEFGAKQMQATRQIFAWAILIVFAGLRVFSFVDQETRLNEMKSNQLPAQAVTQSLENLPQGSAVVLEQSWFLALYLQAIEGVRPDLTLLYLPQLHFPEFFSQIEVVYEQAEFVSQNYRREEGVASPHFRALGASVSFFSKALTSLFFEPVASINGPLRNVTSLDEGSFLRIVGEQKSTTPSMRPDLKELLLGVDSLSHERLRDDALNYLEARATGIADYYAQQGQFDLAAQVLEEVCFGERFRECSAVTVNNLAVYLVREEQYLEAVRRISTFHARRRLNPVLLQNLALAYAHLSLQEREQFRNDFSPEILENIHTILHSAQ